MNSLKCPQCGLVNFATAPECKRCHTKFHQPEPVSETSPQANEHISDVVAADATESWSPPPPPLPREELEDEPSGFSAPMIFFLGYLLLTVGLLAVQLRQLSAMSNSKEFKLFIDPREKLYIPNAEALFYLSWVLAILGVIASLILIVPLLVKMRAFLILVRVYLIASFAYFAVEIAIGFSMHSALTEKFPPKSGATDLLDILYWSLILRIIGFLVTFLWFRYFTTSERVKNTFVN
jgi:hypothetical protein